MEEKKNIFQNKKLLLIIPVLLVVAVIGVTYAFFNYTRTGEENTVGIGRIAFNTDQGNDTLTLTNVFPSSSVPLNADSVSVHITGDTTYDDGEEFQITLVNVVNTVNNKTIPINYVATYTLSSGAAQGATIGTSKSTDDAYFSDRGSTTTVYKLTSTGEVSEGTEVLKGYITSGATGIDGTLTIQAYLDSSKILISDTIQDGDIETTGYVNGTPGAGMTVLTTAEWNALQGASTLSFQIRAVSNEGTWILNPNGYDANIKCQRVTDATKLHTETCSQTSNFCAADGYTGDNTLITYGNAKALNTQLVVGDAFDCDVNGDGIINKDGNGNSTERFYYVSEYYNTDTKQFDDSTGYATLIYYSNTYNNGTSVVISDSGAAYATTVDIQAIDSNATSYDNWHGPVTAVNHLPTSGSSGTWSNITLKTTTRAILAEYQGTHNATATGNGTNTLPTAFSYAGKAARLLTVQEINAGCAALSSQTSLTSAGALKACNFLLEGTMYANSSKATYGPWLETPHASSSYSVWYAHAGNRNVNNITAYDSISGVRPVIDIPYSLIAY